LRFYKVRAFRTTPPERPRPRLNRGFLELIRTGESSPTIPPTRAFINPLLPKLIFSTDPSRSALPPEFGRFVFTTEQIRDSMLLGLNCVRHSKLYVTPTRDPNQGRFKIMAHTSLHSHSSRISAFVPGVRWRSSHLLEVQ